MEQLRFQQRTICNFERMKITVSPNEQGYRIKFKAPGQQPVFIMITDKELEQFKVEVMAAWWQKTKKKELRKYDVTEDELLKQVSPLHSFSNLVKHEETVNKGIKKYATII